MISDWLLPLIGFAAGLLVLLLGIVVALLLGWCIARAFRWAIGSDVSEGFVLDSLAGLILGAILAFAVICAWTIGRAILAHIGLH